MDKQRHRQILVDTFDKLDEWEKTLILLRALRLLLRRKNLLRSLSRLILSPAGVHIDRRQSPRYHMIPERRTENIIARFFQDLLEVEP